MLAELIGRGLSPRSVRLRLTALYGGLFLLSGAGLLAITYLLVSRATAIDAVATSTPGGHGAVARTHSVDLHQLLVQSAVAFAIMTVASVVFGWLVAGRVLRPLRAAFESQGRFVANVSHELRTPLATMRASLDVAMAKPVPVPEHVRELDQRLRREFDRTDRLLDGLLALARSRHGPEADELTVRLDAIASAAVARHEQEIAAMRLTVDVKPEAPVWVSGSETLLSRMVENVIDNAIAHNEPGGWVRITPRADGSRASLAVENGGRLLAQDDVDRLARPFQRLGRPRTGSANGAGLGLSIVASIAEAHGGELQLRARREGGLRVVIALPAAA